jgi:glycosyltransferase involved in cell wall biosynthesis
LRDDLVGSCSQYLPVGDTNLKILLGSHFFTPSVGGVETVSRLLAEHWSRLGHEVIVITTTLASSDEFPYSVIRRPTAIRLLKLIKWADVFFQNNISLRTAWPLAFTRRPWFVTTATWLDSTDRRTGWRIGIKSLALRRAKNIYISRAVAAHVGLPGCLIPNPYDAEIFQRQTDLPQDLDLVFVGRLVSQKGVDILLHALAQLATRGLRPNTTLIGDGPEETELRRLATELRLADQLVFAGPRQGADLARLIARHRIMVVPSRWAETFGVVALEGIACGCAVVGSVEGGLTDAIGPCGLTFPNGSSDALAEVLAGLLSGDCQQISRFLDNAPAHLAKHAPGTIARRYLEIFAQSSGTSL